MDVLNIQAQSSPVVIGVDHIHLIGSIAKLHIGCKILRVTGYMIQGTYGAKLSTLLVCGQYIMIC